MIYTYISGSDTLIFQDNLHQIASINFKSRFKLYKYLKLCINNIDNDFNDFLDDRDINYNTLTLEDINLINNEYEKYLYEFNQHIHQMERGCDFIRQEVLNDIQLAFKGYKERDPTYKSLVVYILEELESLIIGYYSNIQLHYLFTLLKDDYYIMELFYTTIKRKEKIK